MEQTAVEWFVEQIETLIKNGYAFNPKFEEDFIEQAKEMEKQQIIEAHGNKQKTKSDPDSIVTYGYTFTGEAYYNKTYKNTKQ